MTAAVSAPLADVILLDGVPSPGVATIVGAGSPRTWDKKKGWGYSGATLVYTGADLSDFDVILTIWQKTGLQWAQWEAFALVLDLAPVGVLAKSKSIVHPVLNRAPLSITSVVIRDVGQWEQSKTGLWTCRIGMTAYRAPMPALGKPNGTIPASGAIAPFAADPEIEALMKQQAALGGIL